MAHAEALFNCSSASIDHPGNDLAALTAMLGLPSA